MKISLFASRPGPSRAPRRGAIRRPLLAAILACMLSGPASADTENGPSGDSWVEIGFLNQFDADFGDDDGTFDVRGGSGRAQIMIALSDDVRVRTRMSYHGVGYEYDEPPLIAGSKFKPFNTIHVARLNPMIDLRIEEDWTVFAGPLIEASLENSADLGNALKFGGLIGAEYRVSENLSFGAGLVGVSEIEDDFYLQPLLLLDWRPMPKLTIHAESWTTRGGRIEMAYRVLDELEIGTSLRYQRERFRLKRRTLGPGPPPILRTGDKGVVQDRAVIPAVRISYLPDAELVRDTLGSLRLDLEVGVAVAGDVRIEDRNGSNIQTMNYDPAPILELKLVVPLQ